jgi:hypothetical protein
MSTHIINFPGADIHTTTITSVSNVSVGENLDVTSNLTVSGNAVVSQELSVSGNVEVSHELSVSGNVEVGTANLFVDTVTGRVGVGTTEPTESLDIVGNLNLQKVSNTASIKLNSNVVTEFARSKKLIKYPRVAMTGPNDGSGYVVTQASGTTWDTTNPTNNRNAWALFDGVQTEKSGHAGPHFKPDGGSGNFNSSGNYNGSNSLGGVDGDWVSIQLPEKIQLHSVNYWRRSTTTRQVVDASVLGSADGTNWDLIGTWRGATYGGSYVTSFPMESAKYHNYIALVMEKINGDNGYPNFHELELFGVPEYDPDAHGTDVIMHSVPNVPNTDWLEVYYDGQDYTSMPSTVTDKSGNGVTGTPNGNVGFDTEYKAFTFDGSGDFIKGAIPSSLSGNHSYSFSVWIKPDAIQSNFIAVFEMGNRTTNQSCGLYLNGGSIVHLAFGNNLTTSTSVVPNQWIHITGTYTSGSRKVYADGVLLATDTYSSLNIGSTEMTLGANNDDSQEFDGSIANFRLFNRALSADEVWQLYAYQKEYFDVSPDAVTFKGGRLGIGTSEPRAQLDVRGGANFDNPITIGTSIVSSFTGQHVCFPDGDMEQGLIVSANKNKYVSLNGVTTGLDAIRSDESLPIVSLSNVSNDGSVFGVVHELETGGTTRNRNIGGINTKSRKMLGDNRVVVNSLGEGAMWVANTNGNLVSGDYITSSNVAGYGQKQDDDFLHNYTVAKITMDCDFNPQELPVQVIKEELDSHGRLQWEDHPTDTEKAYKIRYLDASGQQTDEANAVHIAAFVGCTYHCG